MVLMCCCAISILFVSLYRPNQSKQVAVRSLWLGKAFWGDLECNLTLYKNWLIDGFVGGLWYVVPQHPSQHEGTCCLAISYTIWNPGCWTLASVLDCPTLGISPYPNISWERIPTVHKCGCSEGDYLRCKNSFCFDFLVCVGGGVQCGALNAD